MTRHALAPWVGAVLLVAVGCCWHGPAAALPDPLVWSVYDEGSEVHAQALAIGRMLRKRHGVTLRLMPGTSELGRVAPLVSGRAQFAATGLDVHHAQEAVYAFAARRSWGPLPVRLAFMAQPDAGVGLAVAGDVGFRAPADLAGKRVAWFADAPGVNRAVEAFLHFGGLGWDDVRRVEVGGFVVAANRLVTGDLDAFLTTTGSTLAAKAAASPRGLVWATFPPDEISGWRRLRSVAPWFVPRFVTAGKSVPERGLAMAVYPTPVLTTLAGTDPVVVHDLVSSLDRDFTAYRDAAPGAEGWAFDRQVLRWVVPWHDGAIRYFIEKGLWGVDEAVHQARLIERQMVLRAAWNALAERDIENDAIFLVRWQQARAAALQAAGFDPVIFGW